MTTMKTTVMKIVSIMLGVIIFFVCALLVREYIILRYQPLLHDEQAAISEETPLSFTERGFSYYESISKNGLFGSGRLSLIEITSDASLNSSEERTNIPAGAITLIGTMVSRSGNSYAVFYEKESNMQKVFKNGEEVFNRGILTNIEYHRAVVRSNSRTFTYSMPFEEVGETPSERQQEAVANQPLSLVQKVREYEWAIDRRALNNMLNDMDKVLTDARLLPYSDSGKVIGFRIGEVKPNGVFRLIGLQNGDILLKVNDYEINSPERGLQLLNGLRGETKVSLDIIRNGKPARLQYQIR